MIKNITNLGDAALYCDFGNEIDQETNLNVIKYFKNLKELKIEGVTNITPSYNKLIISFDQSVINSVGNSADPLQLFPHPTLKYKAGLAKLFTLMTIS